ncbi:hypothetical protein LCGC14_1916820 [marine sediment metagenome]|uniref:Terminase large subunit gp17-like C-terminal domain-containing protein n=1 Tax=marine sediment metagenome TaxID=412755 RepID=A0A0F9FSR2_9ZZZZ
MLKLKWTRPTMDEWQKDILAVVGHLILICGRQTGKTEIIAYLESLYVLNTPNAHLLIVSGVERQAGGLYRKMLAYIEDNHPKALTRGDQRPMRTVFHLENGSVVRTEPLGNMGSGARQHTVTRIVFEEMQLIPEDAYSAITPMLLTTGGDIHMLGTAWATEGYAYERESDEDFTVARIDSEKVAELRPEPQRTIMLKHLERERKRMSEAEYAQEYLAIPSEKMRQIFSDKLIKKLQVLKRRELIIKDRRHSCGVDPAGLGEDEGAITILDTEDNDNVKQVDFIITKKLLTTETTDKIISLDKRYDFGNIYVDDGGVGFGVYSELMANDDTRIKTIPLNNAQRSISKDDTKRKRILKEDLYMNLLKMMERGKIQLLDDPEIRESLKSCKFEYQEKSKKLLITSSYNHPVESLTRAAWDAEGKHLNLKVYSIPV